MDRFLEEALDLAARGIGQTSPNPAVGAVLVREDQVVGRGFHTWAGVKHAEVLAIEEAGERGQRRNAVCLAGAGVQPSWPHAAVHRCDSGRGHPQSGRAA